MSKANKHLLMAGFDGVTAALSLPLALWLWSVGGRWYVVPVLLLTFLVHCIACVSEILGWRRERR